MNAAQASRCSTHTLACAMARRGRSRGSAPVARLEGREGVLDAFEPGARDVAALGAHKRLRRRRS